MVANNEQHILQMPLVNLIDSTQHVKAFGRGIAEFAGLQVGCKLSYAYSCNMLFSFLLGIPELCYCTRFWCVDATRLS